MRSKGEKEKKENLPTELIACVKKHNPQWIVYFTGPLIKALGRIYRRHHKFGTNAEALAFTRQCLSNAAKFGNMGIRSSGMQKLGNTEHEGFIIEDE